MVALLLLRLALAAPPPASEPPEQISDEITIYGDLLVERARQQVIRELKEEGYSELIQRDGYIVLRHPSVWKGEVLLYDDGWMKLKRQALRFQSPNLPYAERGSALAWAHCVVFPLCMKTAGISVSKRKLDDQKGRTVDAIHEDVEAYAERIADVAVTRKVNDLPAALDALWERGQPLVGSELLPTPTARRAALLDFWATRTDTRWGEEVRQAVEAFLRAVVQSSDHPITAAELAAINQRQNLARPLDLGRRSPASRP